MTLWQLRKSLDLCARSGCSEKPIDGSNYCEPHWKDQRDRQAASMARIRAGVSRRRRRHVQTLFTFSEL